MNPMPPPAGIAMDESVSVIIGSYNAGVFLLPSIRSVLAQTYQNLEILIVDDGSSDGSVDEARKVIDDPRIRWFRHENRGRPGTLNRALDEARGEYYVIHDADDLSHPRRIEKLVAAFRQRPHVAGVFSGNDIILGNRVMAPRFRPVGEEACHGRIERFQVPAHDPTGMWRMAMVGDMRYDTDLPYVEAVDYILRVGETFPLFVLGECLYTYRIHDTSVTRRAPETRRRYVAECFRRAAERRSVDFESRFAHLLKPSGGSLQDRDNNLAAQFIDSVWDQRLYGGSRTAAIRTGLQCARLHPLHAHYLKAIIYAVFPLWIGRRLRRSG